MMIRPILDGLIVRMDPPAERIGSIIIPEDARADHGTWRAQREAKIGTVLAAGPGRPRRARTSYERTATMQAPTPDEVRLMWDSGSARGVVPMGVKVGDRVLFDPKAELRPVGDDPLVRSAAEFQAAAVITACPHGRVLCECEGYEREATT